MAARADDGLITLKLLAGMGCKFVLVKARDKKPLGNNWQNRPQTLEQAQAHLAHDGNVGLLCGEQSSRHILLDFDRNVAEVLRRFPVLQGTVRFYRQNAADRAKFLVRIVDQVPDSRKHANMEILANGRQGIVAGVHESGAPILCAGDQVTSMSHDEVLNIWQALTAGEPTSRTSTGTRADADADSRYAQAALERELGRLAGTSEGSRNEQLNKAAFSLGQLVGEDLLNELEVADKLLTVALAIGLKEHEARATIRSGLGKGRKEGRPGMRRAPMRRAATGTRSAGTNKPGEEEEDDAGESNDKAAIIDRGKHDLGNAVYAHNLFGDQFLFTDGLGWLYWTGAHWDGDTAEAKVHGAMVTSLKQRCALALQSDDNDLLRATVPSAKHTRDALFHFKYLVTISNNQFDNEPHLLNVANGVVDLRTGELAAHESSNRFTYCVPTEYIPGARSELWDKLLADWFSSDEEMVSYVSRCLGYSITGETKEETLFYVMGPGRAGKGTLVNTVGEVLGHQLSKGVKFDIFTDSRNDPQNFRLAPLHNARMVIASESKRGERFDEGLVKQLTGRDPIEAAFKHRTAFTFTPRFKIWLMSNYAPQGDVDDDSFWYRIRLIEFTKSHIGTEDNSIKDTLLNAVHRRGILAWLLAGAAEWYKQGLGTPKRVWEAAQEAREEQDHVLLWLRESTEAREGRESTMDELYRNYETWCEDSGIPKDEKFAKNTLCSRLRQKGYQNKRTRRGLASVTMVYGIALVD